VADSAPHLRKPRPEGLIQLADAFRAGRITFVGDSLDDAAALRGARALRPELAWRFAAVGPDRARFAESADPQAMGLVDLLESGDLS
jgi:phosphoglycolate phosphatase-like HAD superfamily hydrolase